MFLGNFKNHILIFQGEDRGHRGVSSMKLLPTHDTPSGASSLLYAYMLCEMIEQFIHFLRVAGTSCTSENVHRGLLDWLYTSRTTLHAVIVCDDQKRRNIILACFVPKNKFAWIICESNVKRQSVPGLIPFECFI